jgi:hypothetical protein
MPVTTAEIAGRVITTALVIVPGPGDTVTFVRQERGPDVPQRTLNTNPRGPTIWPTYKGANWT